MMWKLWITIKDDEKNSVPVNDSRRSPERGVLTPLGISQYRLAKALGISPRRINEIVHGQRAITPDTALRLGKYFGVSAQFLA